MIYRGQNVNSIQSIKFDRLTANSAIKYNIELLICMRYVADISSEDAFRSDFVIEDINIAEYEDDLLITTSTLLDINNISTSSSRYSQLST